MESPITLLLPYLAGAAIIAAALFAGGGVLGLRGLFMPMAKSEHLERRACPACGFEGQVSRYNPKCRSCGAAIPRQVNPGG